MKAAQHIFMLGIAGSGMKGLKYLLTEQGNTVRGFDDADTAPEKNSTEGSDLLIYTDAAPADHPIRAEARKQGIEQLAYHEAVGQISRDYTTIAVTGTHGKSSTTAMIAHILVETGLDPTVLVGADIAGWEGENARLGASKYFVVEADEYRNHFLSLNPEFAVIVSLDYDHPDFFQDQKEYVQAYNDFLARISPQGTVFTTAAVEESYPSLAWPAGTVVIDRNQNVTPPAALPGRHMQMNASLAVALAVKLGVEEVEAAAALQSFPGLSRRMELVSTVGSMQIISDYAHHPVEISATLEAYKEAHSDKRVLVVFQPHMKERLAAFPDEFASALAEADEVALYPTFTPAGREEQSDHSELLSLKTEIERLGTKVSVITEADDLRSLLEEVRGTYDTVLGMSAGDLDAHLRSL